MEKPIPGKIIEGNQGLGTPSPDMVEERAIQIARSDARNEPNDLDRARAHAELTGEAELRDHSEAKEPSVSPWDTDLVSTGERAPTVGPEDEETMPEILIEQGVEEADRDQRSASENSPEQ